MICSDIWGSILRFSIDVIDVQKMYGESVIYGRKHVRSSLCVITQRKELLKNDICLSVELNLNRAKNARGKVLYTEKTI